MTVQPYSREFFAPRPSPVTLFFRTFVLWQLVRFVWINFKMIAMIGKAHSHRVDPRAPAGSNPGARRGAATPAPQGGALVQRLDAARTA